MRVTCWFFLVGLTALAMAACSGPSGEGGVPAAESQSTLTSHAIDSPFSYSVRPKLTRIGDTLLHNCPGGTICALTPTTLRTAYDFTYQPGVEDGANQYIVIVVAYGSPTIAGPRGDLAIFDQKMGLPDPPSLDIQYPGGKPTINLNNASQLGWAEETTLDVEWAHASAPAAHIILVVSNNDGGNTIQAAQQFAINYAPAFSVMALSFGVQESSINGGANNTQLALAHTIYSAAATAPHNDTVIASAGDQGSTAGFSTPNPQYPASDGFVLSVGGTNLTIFNNGKYRSESAWNDGVGCTAPCGATGGAPSAIWTPFPNEAAVTHNGTWREVSDVAYDAADNATAVYIGFSAPGISPGFYAIGGTSVGAPVYAGIVAIANQMRVAAGKTRLGYFTPQLYGFYATQPVLKTPPFHDVTNGTNVFFSGFQCCSAGQGYDMPTGLGSPDINSLLNVLATAI